MSELPRSLPGLQLLHRPALPAVQRGDWLDKTAALLLRGVDYFQVVFTLPNVLSSLALGNRSETFQLLFHTALRELLREELEIEPAALMVLHT